MLVGLCFGFLPFAQRIADKKLKALVEIFKRLKDGIDHERSKNHD